VTDTQYFRAPDGTALAWDAAGSGPLVLLLHGLGSSRRRWDPQMAALSGAGYRAVRVDLRGFGESSGADQKFGMQRFIADLELFADSLGSQSFHLVGHSLGGMVAQCYAVDHKQRIRSLVLASTTSHNGRRASAFARVMTLFADHGFRAVLDDPEIRPEVDHAVKEAFPGVAPPFEMLKIGVEEPNPARANAWRACIEFSVKDRLAELDCPVLVMHGTLDPLIPFRAGQLVHEAIPGSEWLEEAGAGHSLPRERTDSFNRALLDFLSRVDAAR
jgi:pimeloyl-ACP methyl ester carboxylesterase